MSRKRARVSPFTLFFALLSLVLAFALYIKSRPVRREPENVPSKSPRPRIPASGSARLRSAHPSAASLPRREIPTVSAAAAPVRVAILIDDLGNDLEAVDRIAHWPMAISTAVLPRLPGSAQAARELESSGKQVLLHLPMEPRGFPTVAPGPGVVLRAQSDTEIESILRDDLASVPGAVGVNNHMGSAATADPRVMRVVMRVLAARGLFFVDSRTTDATVAEAQAHAAGVPAVSRRVFLDDVATKEAVEKALADLIARGRSDGSAVGIGHPHSATLAVLEQELPHLGQQGVKLVQVGDLVK